MKPVEIRDLETEDLELRVGELKEELFNLRFQLATGQLDNHARLKQVKRDVARLRTIIREREFEAWEAAQQSLAEESAAAAATEPASAEEEAQ